MTDPGDLTADSEAGAKSRMDALPPEVLILTAALSVQCGAGLATSLLREFGPLPVVTMRIVFGALLLLAFQRSGCAARPDSPWGAASPWA